MNARRLPSEQAPQQAAARSPLLVSSAAQRGAYTVPKLFQKSRYLRGNGFYVERKQKPRIGVKPWKIRKNMKTMDWRSKTPKRQVAGSNPAEPTISSFIFNHLEVRSVPLRLAIESNGGRTAMSLDDREPAPANLPERRDCDALEVIRYR